MNTLNDIFPQLSLVFKLLKRKFSKRSDRHDTNYQAEHSCDKSHQESCQMLTEHPFPLLRDFGYTDGETNTNFTWNGSSGGTPNTSPAHPAPPACTGCAFTSGRQRQTASLTFSSIPGGTSRSTSYTPASCQTPQTCSWAGKTGSVNVWSCNIK